jgi:hypothetical protein
MLVFGAHRIENVSVRIDPAAKAVNIGIWPFGVADLRSHVTLARSVRTGLAATSGRPDSSAAWAACAGDATRLVPAGNRAFQPFQCMSVQPLGYRA